MIIRRFLGVSVLLCATLLGACQPYVYEADEFNRERSDFGREKTDRTEVNICYFTRVTTPQDVLAMAESECAKFGKTARYQYSQTGECPLSTPTLGHFSCVAR